MVKIPQKYVILLALICTLLFYSFFSPRVNAQNQPHCQQVEIPIIFNEQGLPFIHISLGGEQYLALVDLGAQTPIHLNKEIITQLDLGDNKVNYTGKQAKSININGDASVSEKFILPELTLGCMTMSHVDGMELNPWTVTLNKDHQDKHADDKDNIILGRGLFDNKRLAIHYSEQLLIIHNSPALLKDSPYSHAGLPFTMNLEGITIAVNSPNKRYQLVLDTGASQSIFVRRKVNHNENTIACDYELVDNTRCQFLTEPLTIAGHDFNSDILLYPIDERFQMDGILGSDFFQQFNMEIDFTRQTINLLPILTINNQGSRLLPWLKYH